MSAGRGIEPEPGIISIGPLTTGDAWLRSPPSIWRGTKVTLFVRGNPVRVRLSRTNPPEPPTWDQAFTLNAGPWSHAGPIGYVDLMNDAPGASADVSGALYRE